MGMESDKMAGAVFLFDLGSLRTLAWDSMSACA